MEDRFLGLDMFRVWTLVRLGDLIILGLAAERKNSEENSQLETKMNHHITRAK